MAHGPAFQKGIVVPAFDNIEIYNLVCGMFVFMIDATSYHRYSI